MTYHVKCKHCGKEFETRFKDGAFCSSECRRQYFVHKKTVANSEKLKREGIEGKDYVIDRWNGLAVKRMYGSYFRRVHPDRTLEEYKKEFPDAKLYSEVDDANVGKSRGLHMKEEKYKYGKNTGICKKIYNYLRYSGRSDRAGRNDAGGTPV